MINQAGELSGLLWNNITEVGITLAEATLELQGSFTFKLEMHWVLQFLGNVCQSMPQSKAVLSMTV